MKIRITAFIFAISLIASCVVKDNNADKTNCETFYQQLLNTEQHIAQNNSDSLYEILDRRQPHISIWASISAYRYMVGNSVILVNPNAKI